MSGTNGERLNRRRFLGWAASGAGGILAAPYVITSTALGAEGRAPAGVKGPVGTASPTLAKWTPLFNGKDLSGWRKTGSAIFKVQDGCLVGTQTTGKGGDLWTEAEFDDFELRVTYRVVWPANTGFWFRHDGRKGYQYDVLKWKNPVAYSGTLYCPGKMFITKNLKESLENRDGWNEARVRAQGDELTLWLNGTQTGQCRDKTLRKGKIGIQVHGGNGFKGMKMIIKKMEVRALAAQAQPAAAKDIPPKTHPDVSKWEDLLKADLSNATYPKGVWSFEKGILTATKDINLWTKKQYDNFIVDVEFKTAPGTNSGVIVYCSNTKKWIPNSVEVQIADDFSPKWAKADKTWQCAAIFGHLAATERMVKKPGEWNRFTITCVDHMIYVMLNGQTVTVMDMRKWTSAKKNPDGSRIPSWLGIPKAKLATKGHIGFQGKHGGVPIYFRNIKIKELKAK
ncbi:MAG: DUF1080 domain-containing protein [Phycisphaerae bacterium]|nr:DUF1080 domain-containing protein [Phycisphaerae bacterium]